MLNAVFNPFTAAADSLCDERLPAFPTCQSGTAYPQYRSQICALVIVPDYGEQPTDWQTEEGWAGVIDNDDTTGQKGRYLVVRGSFLPQNTTEISLSGGRAVETRARLCRFSGQVLNMADGHIKMARRLQDNVRGFNVWLETLGGRLIGGSTGMRPFFVDADIPFAGGNDDRERIDIVIDFHLTRFPDSILVDYSLEDDESPMFWQQEDSEYWMGEEAETDWEEE